MEVNKDVSTLNNIKGLLVLLVLILSACAPSASSVQTAIAKTQAATIKISTPTSIPTPTPTQWAWKVIKSIFTQEQQNDSDIWRHLPLARNLEIPDAFQMKLDMESVGANFIVLEGAKNSFRIACDGGTLGVFLHNDIVVGSAFDNNGNRPGMPIINETTVCQITIIFDQYAKHIEIFQKDLLIFQLTPEDVGDFPGGLFPDGKILEVDLSSSPRSDNKRSGSGHIISKVTLNELVFYAQSAVMSLPPNVDTSEATPTIMPTSTSRPTTFSLYDNFSSGSSNNIFDTTLWSDPGGEATINWQSGYLVFSGTNGGHELKARAPQNWRVDEIGKLQADLRIDSVNGGYAFSKVGIDTTLSDGKGTWWVQCRVGSFNGSSPQIICDSYRWGNAPEIKYQTPGYPIEFGKFYTVAIEIAPDASYVHYFVDGEEIGSFRPEEKNLLVDADFGWGIGLWMDNEVTATGAIDNVMIGVSK